MGAGGGWGYASLSGGMIKGEGVFNEEKKRWALFFLLLLFMHVFGFPMHYKGI